MRSYKWTFLIIEAVMCYEWLVSAINKIASGQFVMGLHGQLASAIGSARYPFYANILRLIEPHAVAFGLLVEIGELLVGVGFLFLIVSSLSNRELPRLGMLVTLAAVFLNANFFFFQNGSYFINPGDPFDEGLPVDFCMVFVQLGLFAFYVGERRRQRMTQTGDVVHRFDPVNTSGDLRHSRHHASH